MDMYLYTAMEGCIHNHPDNTRLQYCWFCIKTSIIDLKISIDAAGLPISIWNTDMASSSRSSICFCCRDSHFDDVGHDVSMKKIILYKTRKTKENTRNASFFDSASITTKDFVKKKANFERQAITKLRNQINDKQFVVPHKVKIHHITQRPSILLSSHRLAVKAGSRRPFPSNRHFLSSKDFVILLYPPQRQEIEYEHNIVRHRQEHDDETLRRRGQE
jgi:hypothetical protein